jgi:predicted DNA-binding antitoxin AbrB/MazE fold protein
MMQTVWAEVREGRVVPLESIQLPEGARVLVTILSEEDDNRFWLQVSQESLADVWDNEQDDVYAQLLKD